MSVVLGILTFFLVLVSIIMVLAILAQRTKSDGGVGSALGGGMAEAAFGAESGNVLTRATTVAAVTFFVLSLGLYLGHIYVHRQQVKAEAGALPTHPDLVAPQTPPPAESAPDTSSDMSSTAPNPETAPVEGAPAAPADTTAEPVPAPSANP